MISKIVGHTAMSQMMRRLRGGPQSMLPSSPVKGSGVPNATGLTPARNRSYAAPKQAPGGVKANTPLLGYSARKVKR